MVDYYLKDVKTITEAYNIFSNENTNETKYYRD